MLTRCLLEFSKFHMGMYNFEEPYVQTLDEVVK